MPQIVQNSQTGEYGVIDDAGNFIQGATVAKHSTTGKLGAFDSTGKLLASSTGTSSPGRGGRVENPLPQDNGEDPNGFFRSAYNQALKPLIDTGKELLDPANYNAAHAKLVVHGILNTLQMFNADRPDLALAAANRANPNGELPMGLETVKKQVQDGNYKGALGSLTGIFAPFFTDEIGTGITKGKQLIKNAPEALGAKVLPKVFPRSGDVLPADTLAATGDQSARSVGQLTGSKAAQFLEQTHGGKVAADLADTQRAATQAKLDSLKKTILPNGIPDNINGLTQKKLAENYFDTEAAKNRQYADFQINHVEPNQLPVTNEIPNPNYVEPGPPPTNAADYQKWAQAKAANPPTIQQTSQVVGPVFLEKTLPLAEDLKTKLDDFKKGPEYTNLPEISKSKFSTISSTVDNLVKKSQTIWQGKSVDLPVASYDKIKQIRTDIGNKLSGLDQFGLGDKMLADIKNSLGEDLQTSVKNYWGNGAKASADLQDANASHSAFKTLFNDKLKGKLFESNPNLSKTGANMADPSTLLNGLDESPEQAKQFMQALGPNNTNLAKGAVMGKLLEGATDVANDSFSADKVINALQSPGYKELFNRVERDNAVNLLRQFRTMDPSTLSSKAGYFGRLAFHLGLPAAGLAIGHFSGGAIAGAVAGAGLEIGMGQFARRILLDRKYARIAAQLPYATAGSAKAGLLQVALMKGLAGTRVSLLLKDGTKVPASVDSEGKITDVQ